MANLIFFDRTFQSLEAYLIYVVEKASLEYSTNSSFERPLWVIMIFPQIEIGNNKLRATESYEITRARNAFAWGELENWVTMRVIDSRTVGGSR